MAWAITEPKTLEAERRAKFGDEEYEARMAVVTAKRDGIKNWKEQIIVGNQFDAIAFSASDKIWPQLKEKSVRFWINLVYKVAGV